MKKKVVSLLLAAAMVLSNVMVTTAAEPGQVTESVELSEDELEVGTESAIVSKEARAADSISSSDRMGLFLMLKGGNISSVLHENYDATVKIPKGLVLDAKNTNIKVQSNYYFGDKLPNMAERIFAVSAPGAQRTIDIENYLGKVRGFKSADLNLTIDDKAVSYDVSANSDSTEFTAKAGAGAEAAFSELYSHMEKNDEAKGILLKKGGYIQIGKEKLEFNNDASDLSIGNGDINVNELKQALKDTFVLKKVADKKDAQIKIMLPKGSSTGIRTRGAVLTTDTLVTVNGLADSFNAIGAEDSILTRFYNALSGTNIDLATAFLEIVSNLAEAANSQNISVDVHFADKNVSVKSIELSKGSAEIEVGASMMLGCKVLPVEALNKGVIWTSSNQNVATVKDGAVTGAAVGTAVITATSMEDSSIKDTCVITVKEQSGQQEVIPGAEGKDPIEVSVDVSETVDESGETIAQIPDEVVDQIISVIANANENEVPVINIPVAQDKAPELPVSILEAAQEAGVSAVVIKTEATDDTSVSVTMTVSIPEDIDDLDMNIPLKTGVSAAIGQRENEIVQDNIPADANVLKLELEHEGAFPVSEVILTLYVKEKGFDIGDVAYVYYVDTEQGTVRSLKDEGFTVSENYTVSVPLNHASAYVVSSKKAVIVPTKITLNQTSVTLTVGQNYALTATVLPAEAEDKTVKWNSSDTGVATVDSNGKITAIAAGSTDIIARTANGKEAVCKVTVNAAAVQADSVSLNVSSLKMKTGDTSRLTADVLPADTTDKSVTWKSSNAEVASVASDGTVTALKRGTATITATTANGKTASCKVTITLAAPVTKVVNTTTWRVKLTWAKVPGADKYVVYRAAKKSGKYKKIGTTRSTSYTNYKLTPNKKYYYKVVSYDSEAGASSKVVAARASLGKAAISSARAGRKTVTLKWNEVLGARRYQVYMRAPGGKYKLVGITKKTSFKQKKLKSKKSYSFQVRAYKTIKGKRYYGPYSAVKRVKVK